MDPKHGMIAFLKKDLGPVYPELRWFNEAEATIANGRRARLLNSLLPRLRQDFLGAKISTGGLSPGCELCGQGFWSCLFINGLCTASCFFCPQDRNVTEERLPEADGLTFEDPDDYVDFVREFGIRGVGISGGEPLLVMDRLTLFISKLKRAFGHGFYIWAYTNGDLVTRESLRALRRAGLDEIRFDLAARDYDLEPVETAVTQIDTVTVEIPAIPEDRARVRRILGPLDKLGVRFLNLHQLHASEFNYPKLIERNYTFVHETPPSVFESEMAALMVIKHAVSRSLRLSVSYCPTSYKHRFQGSGLRNRVGRKAIGADEYLTEAGFIRSLRVNGSNGNGGRECVGCKIAYSEPKLAWHEDSAVRAGTVGLASGRKIALIKEPIPLEGGLSSSGLSAFERMFLENQNPIEILRRFVASYTISAKGDAERMLREKETLERIRTLERIEAGLHPVF